MEPTDERPGRLRAAVRALGRIAETLRGRPGTLTALVILSGVLLVTGRLLFGRRLLVADDIWTNDFVNCNLPPRVFLGHSLRAGQVPLWMPGSFGGLPLIPQGEAAALNPFTWVFFLLPDWVTGANLSIAVHIALGGLGMVLLCRRFGLRLSASLVGALGFMFSGFLVEHAKHMNMHHASVWAPWMIFAADRMFERPSVRAGLFLGIVAAIQVTEGHPQMSYITLFVLFPVLLFRLAEVRPWTKEARYWPRALGASAVALLGFAALSGAYLQGAVELLSRTERSGKVDAWDFATHYEFFGENILTLGYAHVFGDGSNATYNPRHGMFWESWLYVGVVPCAAAIVAVLVAITRVRRQRSGLFWRALFFVALGALAFAFMVGKHSPVYGWAFKVVPGLSWFRFHHRFALVLTVAVTALGAMGVDWAVGRVEGRWGARWAAAIGAALVLVTLGDMSFIMTRHFNGAPGAGTPPATARAILAHAPAEPYRVLSLFTSDTHVDAFHRAHGWSGDTRSYAEQWAFLQPASNATWNIESVSGYASLVPYDVAQVIGTQNVGGVLEGSSVREREAARNCKRDPPSFTGPCSNVVRCSSALSRAYGAYNVRFLLSPGELQRCPGWKPLESISSGPYTVRLFENDNVLPRAYVTFGARDVPDVRAAGSALIRPDFDPTHEVLRTDAPGAAPAPQSRPPHPMERCSYEPRGPGSATVRCTTDQPGFLVIAETRYPGREVRVDGQLTPTFAANGTQIGLELPAGTHEVRLDYRPRYRWLVPIAVLGWAAVAVMGALAARRALPRR